MNSTKKLAVLIVEDSILVRERLRSMLLNLGCVENIVEAGSTPEALQSLEGFRPDAAILDLRLGSNSSGLDVLRVIKRDIPGCTTIILSNLPAVEIQETCFPSGADYCLNKAKEFERVFRVIASIADRAASPCSR